MSKRLTEREAARDVLEMLGRDPVVPARDAAALSKAERTALRVELRDALLPGGVGGSGPFDAALLVLAKDAPSTPGHFVEVAPSGSRVIRDDNDAAAERGEKPEATSRSRPSRRAARAVIRGFVEAVEVSSPEADAFKCIALVLLLFGLDHAAGGELQTAPPGRARVQWLAKRIEDAMRSRAR